MSLEALSMPATMNSAELLPLQSSSSYFETSIKLIKAQLPKQKLRYYSSVIECLLSILNALGCNPNNTHKNK